jgi:hypothetical protein
MREDCAPLEPYPMTIRDELSPLSKERVFVETPNWLGKSIDGDTLIPLISHLSCADKF